MPTYQITGPDGKKYRITGANPEGAMQALQEHLGQSGKTPDAPQEQSLLSKAGELAGYVNPGTAAGRWLAENIVRDFSDEPKKDARDNTLGKIDSFVRGAADTLSFGLADELAAGGDTLVNGDTLDKNLAKQRATDTADAENRFPERLGGQITGGVTQGLGLAKNGLSLTANAVAKGTPLLKTMGLGALEGGGYGALQGFGSGTDTEDRAEKAAIGTLVGTALGGAIPGVVAGAKTLAAPIMARFNPEGARDKVMAALLKRSDMSADDIASQLQKAQADGQDVYMAADTLGIPGQRIMSTAARTPTDARKSVVDALVDRQTSQGDRLSRYLAEGFDANDTAAQRIASLTTDRANTARVNYDAARNSASAVDPTAAIAKADEYLQPGAMSVMSNDTGIADTSIASAVQKAKRFLTDGNSVVSDFNSAFNAKKEIDALIENASPTVQRELIPIKNALDDALAEASQPYAAARDTFKAQSKAIEAVDAGKLASSPRVRSADSIETFQGMSPEERAAFRNGYADPLIARVEAASMSPTTNKARPLMSAKTGDEFPEFAVPGKAEQMGDRIAREQRMFETANAALGGSKTADNLADMADSAIDPGVLAALARGKFGEAALSGITQLANSARGLPPAVIEKLIPALMESNPQAARELFSSSAKNIQLSDQTRAKIVAALLGSGTTAPARIAP